MKVLCITFALCAVASASPAILSGSFLGSGLSSSLGAVNSLVAVPASAATGLADDLARVGTTVTNVTKVAVDAAKAAAKAAENNIVVATGAAADAADAAQIAVNIVQAGLRSAAKRVRDFAVNATKSLEELTSKFENDLKLSGSLFSKPVESLLKLIREEQAALRANFQDLSSKSAVGVFDTIIGAGLRLKESLDNATRIVQAGESSEFHTALLNLKELDSLRKLQASGSLENLEKAIQVAGGNLQRALTDAANEVLEAAAAAGSSIQLAADSAQTAAVVGLNGFKAAADAALAATDAGIAAAADSAQTLSR